MFEPTIRKYLSTVKIRHPKTFTPIVLELVTCNGVIFALGYLYFYSSIVFSYVLHHCS